MSFESNLIRLEVIQQDLVPHNSTKKLTFLKISFWKEIIILYKIYSQKVKVNLANLTEKKLIEAFITVLR